MEVSRALVVRVVVGVAGAGATVQAREEEAAAGCGEMVDKGLPEEVAEEVAP